MKQNFVARKKVHAFNIRVQHYTYQ